MRLSDTFEDIYDFKLKYVSTCLYIRGQRKEGKWGLENVLVPGTEVVHWRKHLYR